VAVNVAGVDVARDEVQPFPVDAVVREEDTYLVLSARNEVSKHAEHPIRLFEELHGLEPQAPGSAVLRPGDPATILAVVHDLGREPSWQKEWIERALDEVLSLTRARDLRSLAMPILGSVHGRLPIEEGRELIVNALWRARGGGLRRLWLSGSAARHP
jgi:hypothetical protein